MDILRTIDLYGFTPNLLVSSKSKYKTAYGGFLTIFSVILTLLAMYFLSIDRLYLKNPKVTIKSEYEGLGQELKIGKDDYQFSFLFQFKNRTPFYDPTIFNVNFKLVSYSRINGTNYYTETPIPTIKCDPDKNFDKWPEMKGRAFTKLGTCVDAGFKFSIFNTTLSNFNSYIVITVNKCQNTTTDLKCRPSKEIDNYLQYSYIDLKHQNLVIDPTKYDNYVYSFWTDYEPTIDMTLSKLNIFWMKKKALITDTGFFYDNEETSIHWADSYQTESISYRSKDTDSLLELRIMIDPNSEYVLRSYKKIWEIAANIGGAYSFIKYLSIFLNYFFSEFWFYEYLIHKHDPNKLLSLKADESKHLSQNYINKEPNVISNLPSAFKFSEIDNQPNILKIKYTISSTKPPKKFRWGQILCYLSKRSGQLNDQERHYLTLKKSLQEKLDIYTVITVLEEIKKMKHILLDDEQISLVQFIKHNILIEKEINMDRVIESFNYCENRGNNIDMKLVKLFTEIYLS